MGVQRSRSCPAGTYRWALVENQQQQRTFPAQRRHCRRRPTYPGSYPTGRKPTGYESIRCHTGSCPGSSSRHRPGSWPGTPSELPNDFRGTKSGLAHCCTCQSPGPGRLYPGWHRRRPPVAIAISAAVSSAGRTTLPAGQGAFRYWSKNWIVRVIAALKLTDRLWLSPS